MKTRKHTIDFADVPDFGSTKMFIRLDEKVARGIANFPLTAERAVCATHFCWRISYDVSQRPDNSVVLRQGFMRASLAEFVGIEEALKRDLLRRGIPADPIQANSGTRPLLHIIRELRNFELHLHSSPLTQQRRQAVWPAPKDSEEERIIDHEIWIIDDLTESQFLQLRNAKQYRSEDIPRLVEWFNSAQKEWGVHDLILRAIETFCMDIISHYKPYLPGESKDA